MANPILNDYFLRQYNSTHGLADPDERAPIDLDEDGYLFRPSIDPMAEQYVRWQVTRFLADLNKDTDAFKSAVSEVRDARLALRDAPADARSGRRAWKQALAKLSGQAGRLLGKLRTVLPDLDADRRFKAQAGSPGPDLFEGQSAFLEDEAHKALTSVKAMFIEPTNVVGIEELKGENVLAHLNRVEKLSKELSDAL